MMSYKLKKHLALFVLLAALLFFADPVSGEVLHQVDFDEEAAEVESFFVMESDEGVNRWSIGIEMDENVEIEEVSSQVGEASYEFEDGQLDLMVKTSFPRKEHDIEVNWVLKDAKQERYPGLDELDMNLFGFEDKETGVRVTHSDILSWHEPLGYRSVLSDGELRFSGEGHLWLRAYISENGKSTENYHYFEDFDMSQAEELVTLVEYMTGSTNPQRRFPVVFLDDESYDEDFSPWSDGTYKTGGLIVLREALSKTDRIRTLLHETVHGFNDRALKWDRTETAYYDEGAAQFVELLASEVLDSPRAEIFGEDVLFEEDGSRYRLPSRSSPEELWNYYKEGEDWIKYWSPRREEFSEVRTFGYVLSELIVRKRVGDRGIESLQEVYSELSDIDRRIDDPEEKAEVIGVFFDLRPCYSENKTEFELCLEEINEQSFDLEYIDLNHTFEDEREEIEIGERRVLEEQDSLDGLTLLLENMFSTIKDFFGGFSVWISRKL